MSSLCITIFVTGNANVSPDEYKRFMDLVLERIKSLSPYDLKFIVREGHLAKVALDYIIAREVKYITSKIQDMYHSEISNFDVRDWNKHIKLILPKKPKLKQISQVSPESSVEFLNLAIYTSNVYVIFGEDSNAEFILNRHNNTLKSAYLPEKLIFKYVNKNTLKEQDSDEEEDYGIEEITNTSSVVFTKLESTEPHTSRDDSLLQEDDPSNIALDNKKLTDPESNKFVEDPVLERIKSPDDVAFKSLVSESPEEPKLAEDIPNDTISSQSSLVAISDPSLTAIPVAEATSSIVLEPATELVSESKSKSESVSKPTPMVTTPKVSKPTPMVTTPKVSKPTPMVTTPKVSAPTSEFDF